MELEPANVAVAVATYRRPAQLLELLVTLAKADVQHILVIDNDPDGSAREVVQDTEDVRYVHEPQRGIAQARNSAVRELRDDFAAIVFVDDDETVDSCWFSELVEAANTWRADVTGGPVVSVFPEHAPAWIVRGGFHQRARYRSGPTTVLPATNNVLIRARAWSALDHPWFDEAFSETGGSDTELFTRMRSAGVTFAWADDAVVSEVVPEDRLTLRWLVRREVRGGNVQGRLRLRRSGPLRVAGRGAAKISYGVVLCTRSLVARRAPRARELNQISVGIGLIGAALRRHVREYR